MKGKQVLHLVFCVSAYHVLVYSTLLDLVLCVSAYLWLLASRSIEPLLGTTLLLDVPHIYCGTHSSISVNFTLVSIGILLNKFTGYNSTKVDLFRFLAHSSFNFTYECTLS